MSLGELFEIEGHRPRVVHSGEAAIQAYVTGNFDIAFMDVLMPGLNGVESFFEIRKLRPEAKVFMMTGYSVEELLKQAMAHGAMGVLNKPMDAQHIVDLLREVGDNGIVVAPRGGANYASHLHDLMAAGGAPSEVINSPESLAGSRRDGSPIILDFHAPLIETVGHYSKLRKNGPVPPTIIVAGKEHMVSAGQNALRDMDITGVLNKPFDPDELLQRLNRESE